MLTSTHLDELRNSAIDTGLAKLNFRTLTGTTPYNYLMYSDQLERTNPGRLAAGLLNRYRHVEQGGWWCGGVDPLDSWQAMLCGQFKPDKARVDSSGKAIKYESPPKTSTRAYFLRVTFAIGLKIAQKFGCEEQYGKRILQAYTRSQAAKQGAKTKRRGFGTSAKITKCGNPGRTQIHSRIGGVASNTHSVSTRWLEAVEDASFWPWVLDTPKIPLVLTEGSKKCASLLSAGYVAISLPGVTGGAKKLKDQYGNEIGKSHLIPELEAITAEGRGIFIAFDQDSKCKTIRHVSKQVGNLSRLLQQKGCKVWIVNWEPSQGKGCDDLIANYGCEAFDKVFAKGLSYESWQVRSYGSLTYTPSLTLDQKYLGNVSAFIPKDARLICLKSAKGSGKTQSLKQIVEQAHSQRRQVLLLSHRVQLCQALCDRLKLPSVYEALEMCSKGNAAAATLEISVNGFGLCVDSLHPKSQAHFTAEGWEDADIVLDEATQVLWHTLNSSTCKGDRVAILRELKTLLSNALSPETRGRVILSDADLSDVAVDFVKSVAHQPNLEPWLCLNNWKPESDQGWQIHNYKGPKEEWLISLEYHIADGGRPLICLDSQKLKGNFSTSSLEKWLAQKFPEKRILRIDSQTLQLQDHPAFGSMCNLDKVIANFDVVLCSPTLETGISLDIKEHFTSVWGLFQGCLPANSVRQALARLREPVPRHIWIAPYGFGSIGNSETSVKALLDSQNKQVLVNLHLIFDASIDEGDVDTNFITGAKDCWAKMAVLVNAGLVKYRNSIIEELAAEGHQIIGSRE